MSDIYLDASARQRVVEFYRSIDDPVARSVLGFLINHPGQRFNGESIVAALGLSAHREVARSTYEMGLLAARFGLPRPWTEGQIGYLMPEDRAVALREVRNEVDASH